MPVDNGTTAPDTAAPDPAGGSGAALRRWGVLLGVVVLAVVAWWVSTDDGPACELPGSRLCPIPAAERPVAPVTALPVLGDQQRTLAIDEFAGDVVVVNMWGSWCGPCRAEQPDLNEVALAYRDRGVQFLGVDVNEVSETNGLRHQEEFSIPYESLWDPDFSYAADFDIAGPQSVPSTVVIDREGRVAVTIPGITTATELSVLLDEVLAEG